MLKRFTRTQTTTACAFALAALGALANANAQSTQTLSTITVQGADDESLPPVAPGGQAATGARLGILGNVDILDAPISITSYTAELIQDQQARTLADVLQSDPSVRFTTNSGHMLEHFTIRGLDVSGPSIMLNGLYGIAPKGHVPTEFLERVEVMRGPSALLSGMAPVDNIGGTVNLVTKRATAEPITNFTTSYSSDSYFQGHVDVGRRFGEEQQLGIRFNGAYGSGDTGVEDQKKQRRLGALALDYQGNNWGLKLDAYSSREKIENGSQGMYGLVGRGGVGELVDVPDAKSNMFRGTHGTYDDEGFSLRGDFKLNDNLNAYASVGAANSTGKGLMFGTRVVVTDHDGSADGYVYNVHTITRGRVAETGLDGRFNTGSVVHNVRASASWLNYKEGTANNPYTGWPQNIYDPISPPQFPGDPGVPDFSVDNILTSYALADTMDMANGKVLLTLGARLQRVKQKLQDYDESKLSPSIGVVVKPWGENTSLFANYMEGLSPGETVPTGYDNEGETFKPLTSKQTEVGFKQRLGTFTHTVSAFQIERPTLVDSDDGLRLTEGGDQRLRGVEWSMFGQITPTLGVLGGVAYMDAQQRDTGLDSYAVPKWTANLGLDWTTPITGLNVGGRVVYTGKQWADTGNTIELPSWHRFDLNARYATKISNTPVTFNLYVENVTGREYWSGLFNSGFLMPASPRTVRLAATFEF
ncbi:TonB-dependent siderophore receptor [Pusillimonas sp. T7-7]|uniref:TonB-dependent receptor n=1 Tax=Pusillimonas sp. (strain T7-7) TaxID=1007105 RepID=UPI00020847CA|nr:TonB-dependent siderophore receptor [Pusillimonas sp. T7-7]AEC22148.1 TonB-dependent siderophore receptor [Pusillimonas sp. T7-7]